MVIAVKRLTWICALLAGFLVRADGIPAYKVGDTVQADITASVPFDVANAEATASLKTSRAEEIPAIYRADVGLTNVIAAKFLAAFDEAHSNFCNAIVATYHQAVIDDATIEASDFGYFVTAFNVENKKFPVTAELAVAWARGDDGVLLRSKWLGSLLSAMANHVRADKPPAQFIVRRTIRVVPVTSMDQTLSLTSVRERGYMIATTNVPTITHWRMLYRQQFSQVDQPLARVLANFIQPDCIPDVALTTEARDLATRQIVVSDHYDIGQIIVRHGQVIDTQMLAALNAFNQQLLPTTLNQQIANEHENSLQQQQLAAKAQLQAQQAQQDAETEHQTALLALQQQQQALQARNLAESQAEDERARELSAQAVAQKIRQRNEWLVAAMAAVSVVALLVLWRSMRRRPVPISVPAKLERMEKPTPVAPAELAPYLAQTLKEAVVQGLASQRAELLEAQRLAAMEIAELVERLDQLQAPMQERLRAYQDRIQELQKELAQRTEENRELLRLKIEMMRRQLESERGRVKLN
jgi:hypothetical protein